MYPVKSSCTIQIEINRSYVFRTIEQTSQMFIHVNLWQKSLVHMLYGLHNILV